MPSNSEFRLRRIFDAALAAALPEGKFDGKLPPPPVGRTIVLGAGKAAASMAAAFEAAWEHPCVNGGAKVGHCGGVKTGQCCW